MTGWISVEERFPKRHCMLKIKTIHGDIFSAFFNSDKLQWVELYGRQPAYFQRATDGLPIDDIVSEWFLAEGEDL